MRPLAPAEVAEARRLLSPAEFALFLAADQHDQRHSFELLTLLRWEGMARGTPPRDELLVAALLHDVGKGRLRTRERVAFVVLNALAPRLARRVEAAEGMRWRPGWRQGLWRLRHHARLGADILRVAGSSERVVEIVESHTLAVDRAPDPEVAWFIASDDRV